MTTRKHRTVPKTPNGRPESISRPTLPSSASGRSQRWAVGLAAALLVASILAAYHNTLKAPWVFDDITAVLENPSIRTLWPLESVLSPPPEATTLGGRPIANLSLAANYAVSGTSVWSYHAANLGIHILAALTLFGLTRRTLLRPALADRFGRDALPLALAVALLWALHPLQTEAVTYVVQRVESLMGLFYLLALYGLVRSVDSPRPLRWHALSMAVCLLGMGTKEVMATAPLAALLYDRTFLGGSFRAAWRRRRGLYIGLAATWIALAFLLSAHGWGRGSSAGFYAASPTAYWLTQFGALCHYLRLAVWPNPLVFDYGAFLVRRPVDAAPAALLVLLMIAGCAAALRRRPVLGFLGAWFFLILAPTSIVPVATQTQAEHRMYLPLVALVTLAVLGFYTLGGRRCFGPLAILALILGATAERRNRLYLSTRALWGDTVEKRPDNPRAHDNFGLALFRDGETEQALQQYEAALALEPANPGTLSNYGNALSRAGRWSEAQEQYRTALRIQPDFVPAHYNLAKALDHLGKTPEAIAEYEATVRAQPDYLEAEIDLGADLAGLPARSEEAIRRLEAAIQLSPGSARAHFTLAEIFAHMNRGQEAIAEYEAALRLQPDLAEADNNLGLILCASGHIPEGINRLNAALKIKPDYAMAHFGLANALAQSGRIPEAVQEFEAAVKFQPDLAEANTNLGMILCRMGRTSEGVAHIESALRSRPDYAQAHFAKGLVFVESGRKDLAFSEVETLRHLHSPLSEKLLQILQTTP